MNEARYLVVCSVKDEGPYLVEWICWYRSIGFTDVLVLSNDCTDHSPQLLDAMASAGWCTHISVRVPTDQFPAAFKLEVARRHPLTSSADWVFVCDVDEFLVIHSGQGKITDLLRPTAENNFLGMAINWRCFGTSGHKDWSDDLVHHKFTMAATDNANSGRWLKSIFRHPEIFSQFMPHGPWKVYPEALNELTVNGKTLWVNSEGRSIPQWRSEGPYLRMMEQHQVSYARAQLNHYIVRDETSFWLKKGTPSASAKKNRYTDTFFRNFNRNDISDTSAKACNQSFLKVHQEAMELPGVRQLHQACCADLQERIAQKKLLSTE